VGFEKGHAKLGGRAKGQGNKVASDIKAACQRAGPALVQELLRLATHSRSEMVRITAAKEILDRGFGKARQTVEGEVFVGVSLQLKQLLDRHDGESRSLPVRSNDALIEHDANGSDHGNNGNGELH
jgi:hypothetical protein